MNKFFSFCEKCTDELGRRRATAGASENAPSHGKCFHYKLCSISLSTLFTLCLPRCSILQMIPLIYLNSDICFPCLRNRRIQFSFNLPQGNRMHKRRIHDPLICRKAENCSSDTFCNLLELNMMFSWGWGTRLWNYRM